MLHNMLKQLKSHKYFTWECAKRDRFSYYGHFLHSHAAGGDHDQEEQEQKYGFGREIVFGAEGN